ncbi:MAG: hypothetical protein WAM60_15845 [Candidatus Promineifilaceae bacterium]
MNRRAVLLLGVLLLFQATTGAARVESGGASPGVLIRISVSSDNIQSNGLSDWPAISRNGRYMAYHSLASNLVPDDTNNSQDVFLYDLLTQATERVSLGIGGVEGNNQSSFPDLSSDGRFITFHSEASNLVPNDTNNTWDVFLYDRLTGNIERISVSYTGAQTNNTSIFPDISGDGRFIAYYSYATNLVPNDTNGVEDIFLYDRLNQTTKRISVSSSGLQANGSSIFPDISADGRYITFDSEASNLITGDTNNVTDIYLYDRINQTTQRVSIGSNEEEGNGISSYAVISDNDRFVTYGSHASNIDPDDPNAYGDVYVRDLVAGTTELITRGLNNQPTNGDSHYPVLSADGRFVAYHSEASNLVPGDTNNVSDIFLFDHQTGITRLLSQSEAGNLSNGTSYTPAISSDGRFLVFQSSGNNLVPNDTNDVSDIFFYMDLTTHTYFPLFFR